MGKKGPLWWRESDWLLSSQSDSPPPKWPYTLSGFILHLITFDRVDSDFNEK